MKNFRGFPWKATAILNLAKLDALPLPNPALGKGRNGFPSFQGGARGGQNENCGESEKI